MITKSLTITRNFRTHNEDVYLKETRERVVDLQDGEDAAEVEQIVIRDMIASFKKSYPNVYTHLNFDEVRQMNNGIQLKTYQQITGNTIEDDLRNYNNNLANANEWTKAPYIVSPSDAKFKPTIEEPYDIIKEMDSCKSLTVLKIYEKQCKTAAEKDAYKKKVKELNKQSV